ncbi:MAG TPA: FHA domain-containing protein [Thermopolyspora sp.]|jgi:FOG: FHA domain
MSELTLLLIRLAFLAVLWFFVIAAVGVIRTDLFGARTAPATPRKPPNLMKQASKPKRGEPRQMIVTGGPLQGTVIELTEKPITIGRATDSTLVLSDDYASSRHARLFPQDGQWIVEDLGSTNGTYLDRSKVIRQTPVPLGVPIRIGKTVIELRK